MYDFRDVSAASKAEQIRAWSVEQAINSLTGAEITNQEFVGRAEAIANFVLNGNED